MTTTHVQYLKLQVTKRGRELFEPYAI
uniref:Uncharacterized protein n=1 Tax=Arundo donax TaxID=35708 RepID=A0A0A9BQX5_ARUDO